MNVSVIKAAFQWVIVCATFSSKTPEVSVQSARSRTAVFRRKRERCTPMSAVLVLPSLRAEHSNREASNRDRGDTFWAFSSFTLSLPCTSWSRLGFTHCWTEFPAWWYRKDLSPPFLYQSCNFTIQNLWQWGTLSIFVLRYQCSRRIFFTHFYHSQEFRS